MSQGIVQQRKTSVIQRYSMENDALTMGITFMEWRCLWGYRHGYFRWAPNWLRHAFVLVWNRTACIFLGHDTTELDIANDATSEWPEDRRPCCVHCSRPLRTAQQTREGSEP